MTGNSATTGDLDQPEPWILDLIRAVEHYACRVSHVTSVEMSDALAAVPEVWREAAREAQT
ncbi:MAG: hypothetical protein M3O32_11420 [Actinomycetota bacterium]|nr:hypothetical protein [Actinomycetota bacterium]